MAELLLSFTPPPRSELIATRFVHRRLKAEVASRLGAYDRSFRWTSGVQALTALILKTAAWGRNGRAQHPDPPCLEGRRPSMAATLNDVVTSKPRWAEDMFGAEGGRALLSTLIGRWNPDFNTCRQAPVRVWLECDELPPETIMVHVDGREVKDAATLAALADDISWQWADGKQGDCTTNSPRANAPETDASSTESVGIRIRVNPETVLIEIELDRDFDRFGPPEEEAFLDAIRALLKTSREIPVRGKRRGSVFVALELTPQEVEKLKAALEAGKLAEHGARRVGLAPLHPRSKEPKQRRHLGESADKARGRGTFARQQRVLATVGMATFAAVVVLGAYRWPDSPPVGARPPNTADEFFARGQDYLHAGDTTAAQFDFLKAHDLSGDPWLLAYAAYSSALAGQASKSTAFGQQAVRHGAASAAVLNNLGYALLQSGRYQDAIAVLDEAVKSDPGIQAALYNRAFARYRGALHGRQEPDVRCAEDIRAALAAGPPSADLHFDAARIFAACSRDASHLRTEAIEQIRAAITAGKDPAQCHADYIFRVVFRDDYAFRDVCRTPRGPDRERPRELRLVEPRRP